MAERFDVIVIGGGVMGTAAALELARRGRDTVLLERFTFGHASGSSGGPTRIFRLAYHRPEYVELARAARDAWDELQDAAGEDLLRVTGCIDVGNAALERAALLEDAGLPVERLRGADAAERWPMLRFPPDVHVVHQRDGGVVHAAPTVIAQARLAAQAGATMLAETTVTGVEPKGSGVEVHADGASFEAPVAIVAAGSWTGPLLADVGVRLPLEPRLEQSTYFRLTDDAPGGVPPVIDWVDDPQRPAYFVPDPWEPGTCKVGHHLAGPTTDPDRRTFDAAPERVERATAWIGDHVPSATATGRTDTCLYTVTPDEDFVLGRVGPIVVASPCSGHGFKFAPLFGRVLADLASGIEPACDLTPFRLDRPSLGSR